ncbi:hypothetical protein E2C01_066941 [Portunus trituberculatus]|uniref:Uncharacterized protein n=1 Tax=Portunus trituberculatus TaxID=210409 RepID=A0A5B7HJK2_PORTR|nr:hypothetical protein [Portunus trituberculatus]
MVAMVVVETMVAMVVVLVVVVVVVLPGAWLVLPGSLACLQLITDVPIQRLISLPLPRAGGEGVGRTVNGKPCDGELLRRGVHLAAGVAAMSGWGETIPESGGSCNPVIW